MNYLGVRSGVAGLAVALIFGVGPHMGFKMPKWLARAGFVTGILLLAASPLIFLFREGQTGSSAASGTITNTGNNNCNVAGSGNQVNCGSSPNLAHPLDEKLIGPHRVVQVEC